MHGQGTEWVDIFGSCKNFFWGCLKFLRYIFFGGGGGGER